MTTTSETKMSPGITNVISIADESKCFGNEKVCVKVQTQDGLRKLRVEDYEDFISTLGKNLKIADFAKMPMYWLDEENDWIKFSSSEEFEDAVKSSQVRTLRIRVGTRGNDSRKGYFLDSQGRRRRRGGPKRGKMKMKRIRFRIKKLRAKQRFRNKKKKEKLTALRTRIQEVSKKISQPGKEGKKMRLSGRKEKMKTRVEEIKKKMNFGKERINFRIEILQGRLEKAKNTIQHKKNMKKRAQGGRGIGHRRQKLLSSASEEEKGKIEEVQMCFEFVKNKTRILRMLRKNDGSVEEVKKRLANQMENRERRIQKKKDNMNERKEN